MCRLLIIFSLVSSIVSAPFAWAESENDVENTIEILHKKRMIGGGISTAIGLTFLFAPSFSSSFSSTDRLLFSIGGVMVTLGGIKSFFDPTESEHILTRMEEMRRSGTLTRPAELAMVDELGQFARSERYWGAAMAFASGGVSIVTGTNVNDDFFKTFTVTLGVLSIVFGGLSLFRPTPLEKLRNQEVTWNIAPTVVTAQSTSTLGMGISSSF